MILKTRHYHWRVEVDLHHTGPLSSHETATVCLALGDKTTFLGLGKDHGEKKCVAVM